MFEAVSIRNRHVASPDSRFDLGFLAETMLFYGHVHVFADRGTLQELVTAFGPELLLEYLKEELFTMTYTANMVAVRTENKLHDMVTVELQRSSLQDSAQELFVTATGKEGRGRRLARQLVDCSREIRFPNLLADHGRSDVLDGDYVRSTVATVLRGYAPEYRTPTPLIFDVQAGPTGLRVSTNIDFVAANESYHRHVPAQHSSLSEAYLLSYVSNARADLYLASEVNAEMAVDAVQTEILRSKLDSIIQHERRIASLEAFKDVILDGSPDVRAIINNGTRGFKELRDLVKNAKRFRHWLADKSPDADLAKNYLREVTKDSWVDKLPTKLIRFGVLTGLGKAVDLLADGSGVGTAIGIGIGIADTFLLDRLLKGWRPNQFVEGDLKKFLLG
jgi:hypothetical protein